MVIMTCNSNKNLFPHYQTENGPINILGSGDSIWKLMFMFERIHFAVTALVIDKGAHHFLQVEWDGQPLNLPAQ